MNMYIRFRLPAGNQHDEEEQVTLFMRQNNNYYEYGRIGDGRGLLVITRCPFAVHHPVPFAYWASRIG
jgi:hypothetical protein